MNQSHCRPIIWVRNLWRVYHIAPSFLALKRPHRKEIIALRNISFEVEPGEIFCLVGPNGAGKTTLIKILTTLLIPTQGECRILGYDVVKEASKIRPRINLLFGGERGLYWRLTGRDNLKYFASLYNVPPAVAHERIKFLLDLVGLKDRADDRVETYSRGMKQRLHIARALVNDPEIIFLDEPTIGLDPEGARDLRKLIKTLSSMGKTIFLTTHYMPEAEELAHRIAILYQGSLLRICKPIELKEQIKGLITVEIDPKKINPEKVKLLENQDWISRIHEPGGDTNFSPLRFQSGLSPTRLMQRLAELFSEEELSKVFIKPRTVEEAYLAIIAEARCESKAKQS